MRRRAEDPRHKSYVADTPVLATPLALAEPPLDGPVRVFVHLPKCGGTTLNVALASCARYAGQRFHRFAVGHSGGPPVWLAPGWTGALARARRTAWLNRFLFDHVAGHFPIDGRRAYGRGAAFFTLTRDPVARELSSYNFHYQRGFLAGGTDLLGLYRDGRLVDNPQTRLLAGAAHMHGAAGPATLEAAQANLAADEALAAPVTEADTLLRLLLALNGWPPVLYRRAQITREKAADGLDNATAEALREIHRLDEALHAWVAHRWTERLRAWGARDTALAADAAIVSCPTDLKHKRAYARLSPAELPAQTTRLTLDAGA